MTKEQQKAEILKMCEDSYARGCKDNTLNTINCFEAALELKPDISALDLVNALKGTVATRH